MRQFDCALVVLVQNVERAFKALYISNPANTILEIGVHFLYNVDDLDIC
jgi:hypothetical protein